MKQKPKNYHEKYAKFYNSAEWKFLRSQKFYESDGLCEMCQAKGIIRVGQEVHHKIPINEDWSKRLDYDNLILLCSECHNLQHERASPLQMFLESWENLGNNLEDNKD